MTQYALTSKKGDEVYGLTFLGSMAEYTSIPCEKVTKKPKGMSFEVAAGLPVVSVTTEQSYSLINLTKGQHVLVVGASGGCGIFGVTMAKAIGAKVTAICSTKNVEYVKSLGADVVVDYKDQAQMDKLKAGGQVFDVVYDTVTSFDPVDPDYEPIAFPLLKPSGEYVAINGAVSDWARAIFAPLFEVFGVALQRPRYHLLIFTPHRNLMEKVNALFERGLIPLPPIDMQIKLDSDAALRKAWDRQKSRRAVGKIVVTF